MPRTASPPPYQKIFLHTHLVHKPRSQLIKTDQQEFIHSLAHFYKKARDAGELDEFFRRVYRIWFTKWELTAEDFSAQDFADQEFVSAVREKIKKQIRKDLIWYSYCPVSPYVNLNQTWQIYMDFREARVGIFDLTLLAGRSPILSSPPPPPRHPRPLPIRKRSSVASASEAPPQGAPVQNALEYVYVHNSD